MMEEIFIPVIGFESTYHISNYGNVKSLIKPNRRKEGLLNHCKDGKKYHYVVMVDGDRKKMMKIHRLVAIHFIVNPENKPQVNHKDGDKSNNLMSNLEWVSGKENIQHAFKIGLRKDVGENCSFSKFKEQDILQIRDKKLKGESVKKLAADYKTFPQVIYSIVNRKTWKHL